MTDINSIHLLGTVDGAPELGETTRGVETLNFWVKTVDKDRRIATHRVVAWGKLARERAWKRGDRVRVLGNLQYRVHRDRPVVDVVAHQLILIGESDAD